MPEFNTKVEGYGDKEYHFDCYDNTEPIDIGEKFIFFFAGIADVQVCHSETSKYEINSNDRKRDRTKIDLVTGFWKNCYKIKETDFNLESID